MMLSSATLLTGMVWMYVHPGYESWACLISGAAMIAASFGSHPIGLAAYCIVTTRVLTEMVWWLCWMSFAGVLVAMALSGIAGTLVVGVFWTAISTEMSLLMTLFGLVLGGSVGAAFFIHGTKP